MEEGGDSCIAVFGSSCIAIGVGSVEVVSTLMFVFIATNVY